MLHRELRDKNFISIQACVVEYVDAGRRLSSTPSKSSTCHFQSSFPHNLKRFDDQKKVHLPNDIWMFQFFQNVDLLVSRVLFIRVHFLRNCFDDKKFIIDLKT